MHRPSVRGVHREHAARGPLAAVAVAVGLGVAPVALPAVAGSAIAGAQDGPGWGVRPGPDDAAIIARVVALPSDAALQRRAQRLGLNVVNVMWEDTGRSAGSSVGPNISDVTLQVRESTPQGLRTHLLPVIRHPNFTDRTADIPADRLWVRVGNQSRGNGRPAAVPLREVLANLREYLSNPSDLVGSGDLTAPRDTHYLVSAQHVFVPLPAHGRAEFNPVLFNYQSAPGSPAVLALLVTREGTSVTVIDNRPGDRTSQGWGQQLYHNDGGRRTAFTAERRSAVQQRVQHGQTTRGDDGALEEGADMMMIVQVPLRHQNRGWFGGPLPAAPQGASAPMAASASLAAESSDVERAVLGHGEDLGPFREIGGLRLERDPRFPVRVTVQFYRATSNGVIGEQDLADVQASIVRVYRDADWVGSLVVPESERDRRRPTHWTGAWNGGGPGGPGPTPGGPHRRPAPQTPAPPAPTRPPVTTPGPGVQPLPPIAPTQSIF
jgi:hypothetical protein